MSQPREDIAGIAGIAIIGLAFTEGSAEVAAAAALADAGYRDPAMLANLQRTAVITAVHPTEAGLAHHLTSARIAQWLDFHGPAYVVNAAAAPELVAIDLAVNELRSGRCDLALAGAARAHQAGMLVLKRLEDAEQAGDRVYAAIKSIVGSAAAAAAADTPVAGIEGLIQTALALHTAGTQPATGGFCETPRPAPASAAGLGGIRVVLEARGGSGGNAPRAASAWMPNCDFALAAAADSTPVIEQHFRTMARFLEVEKQVMSAYLAQRGGTLPASLAPVTGPLITEVLELAPGVRARARHCFSLERERLFAHHTLGRNISQEDPELAGLPVVPLAIFMEILAEAGALLQPGQVFAGMRDFHAYRWITLEEPGFAVELAAEQREAGAVYVTMRESRAGGRPQPVLAEGLMRFSPAYAPAGSPESFTLENERGSCWTPNRLYSDGMFPGPVFQAVKSMDRTGENGAVATLEVLPRDAMIAGMPQPAFLIDPVTLDAAGQALAFWAQEQLDPTGDVFPYRLAALDCYGPPPAPGARLECRAAVIQAGDRDIRADIEILDAHGRLLYRIADWEGRRFPQTLEFWQLRLAPRESCLSNLWNEPVAAFRHQPLVCCRLESFSREFFEAANGIWLKVLAFLVLSRREREQWLSMRAVDKRRREWLLGRCAAKDAVRLLIERNLGVHLAPADIEIVADPYGAPHAEGAWTRRLRIQPAISISHSRGTAVALAGLDSGQLVGIDLESVSHRREDFEAIAFSPEERQLLADMRPELRQEWALRMWCAKESVAKALGRGLAAGMHAFRITATELDTGIVQLELRDGALDHFPHLRGKSMIAYTARETDFVFSTLIYQQGVVQ
jgi:phosphopantetheinyl transferase